MQPDPMNPSEEILVIDLNHVLSSLRSKWRRVVLITLGFVLISTFVAFFLFDEKFKSIGTLLFNPADLTTVITDIQTNNHFLKGEGLESSPYKTQEELLKSKVIANKVFEALQREKIHLSVKKPYDLIKHKILDATQIQDTDVIRISAKASTPEVAQKMARIYLQSYLSLMHDISYEPLMQQKALFSQQVTQADLTLQKINTQLQLYQQRYGIIDIADESQSRVSELIKLDTDLNTTEATLTEKQAEVSRLRNQLQLKGKDINTVLQAVAQGQDLLLNNMEDKLQQTQKDYNVKALIYSATNPDMRQLQEQINTLKRQITDQKIATSGQSLSTGKEGIIKDPVIKDSVRTELVSHLASDETETIALQRKMATIQKQSNQLNSQLSSLPREQVEYARLVLEQHDQEDILTKVKQKLSEVQIQEASLQKNLRIIDEPDLPQDPVFPRRWHIIVLAGLLGFLGTVLIIGWRVTLGFRQLEPDYVENVLRLPVLSSIPWLSENQWQHYRQAGLLEVNVSQPNPQVLKAYQDLAINLKAQKSQGGKNTLVLASVLQESAQDIVLANLGLCLAQSGEQVLLMDANLRTPGLHEPFQHLLDYDRGLLELINDVSEQLYLDPQSGPEQLAPLAKHVAIPSGVHAKLHYLNAGMALENPFEFLNAKGFCNLIQALQSSYDWVLLNAPPFLKYPDSSVLLGSSDGLLLLIERDADEAKVKMVQNQVRHLNKKIRGTILRSSVEK